MKTVKAIIYNGSNFIRVHWSLLISALRNFPIDLTDLFGRSLKVENSIVDIYVD